MKLPQRMRLQRMIALSSELSRRAAEQAIERGDVTVNDEVVTKLGSLVNVYTDIVKLKGQKLIISTKRRYLAYHKPKHMIVTKSDPEGRPTIWDDLKDFKKSLNTIGRLDFDSEGLILLSDDGDFINKLTHPKHEIWKTYRVWVKGRPSNDDIAKLKHGVQIPGGKTLPATVKVHSREANNSLLEISIREGKNRQVRRMFEAIGYMVRSLKRISIGPVKLSRLAAGKWRELRPDEVQALISMSKDSPSGRAMSSKRIRD